MAECVVLDAPEEMAEAMGKIDSTQEVLAKFLSMCQFKMKDPDDVKAKRLDTFTSLIDKIASVRPNFVGSPKFMTLIDDYTDLIGNETDDAKVLKHYRELVIELKPFRIKKVDEKSHERNRNRASQKKVLEHEIKVLKKKIVHLGKKPLNLDDLDNENSSFMKQEKCQREIMRKWKALRKLEETSLESGRQIEKRFIYDKSEYPDINKAVTIKVSRILRKKNLQNDRPMHSMPDFNILKDVITDTMKQHSIYVPDVDALSKKILADVVNEIKRRRHHDYEDQLEMYLKESVEDTPPDENDPTLNEKLRQNDVKAEDAITEILEKYSNINEEIDKEECIVVSDTEDGDAELCEIDDQEDADDFDETM